MAVGRGAVLMHPLEEMTVGLNSSEIMSLFLHIGNTRWWFPISLGSVPYADSKVIDMGFIEVMGFTFSVSAINFNTFIITTNMLGKLNCHASCAVYMWHKATGHELYLVNMYVCQFVHRLCLNTICTCMCFWTAIYMYTCSYTTLHWTLVLCTTVNHWHSGLQEQNQLLASCFSLHSYSVLLVKPMALSFMYMSEELSVYLYLC